eukprot:1882587-Amphidinium_carterae.6
MAPHFPMQNAAIAIIRIDTWASACTYAGRLFMQAWGTRVTRLDTCSISFGLFHLNPAKALPHEGLPRATELMRPSSIPLTAAEDSSSGDKEWLQPVTKLAPSVKHQHHP